MDIRPAQLDELKALSAFLTDQGMPRSEEYLHWKFWQVSKEDTGPRSWVAILNNQIVGHIGIMPTTISLGGVEQPTQGGWFVDWIVRTDVRSRGIGILLLREAMAAGGLLMTIQGSMETQRVLPQLNWTEAQGLKVYKLNVRASVNKTNRSPLATFVAEVGRRFYFHPVRKPKPSGWILSEDESDWSRLETVVRRVAESPDGEMVHFDRSAEFLRWHFREHPIHRYQLMMAHDSQGPCGYAIWRMAPREDGVPFGRLVDLALSQDQTMGWAWLVSETVARMIRAGAVQIDCLAGEGSPLERALRQNRFLARQSLPLWMSSSLLTDRGHWHATFADSDIDSAAR